MKRTTLLSLLVLSAILIPALVSTPTVLGQESSQAPRKSVKTFNLDFKGGSVQSYVEAILRVYENANIIVMPEASGISVPPFKLNTVSLNTAMDLLDNRVTHIGGQVYQLKVEMISGRQRNHNSKNVYTISANFDPQPMDIQVHSVLAILGDDFSSDDLMTAIESTLEILPDEYTPAQIRFHAKTGILIIRAHPRQVHLVQNVLSELQSSAERKRNQAIQKSRQDEKLQEAGHLLLINVEQRDSILTLKTEVTSLEKRNTILDQENQRCRDEIVKFHEMIRILQNERADLQSKFAELQGVRDKQR
ncbi:MAG: hypothetical protein O7G85_12285 [Planctomycetota bacterium]|nr:hypothetical protein [Planctomycetota bacterium]